ncbi:MAG: ArnT family glycosyltransferase [bacterium]
MYIIVYIFVACNRINYPYELEWMEGGIVDHVQRVLEEKQLYVEPSIEFTPFIYTPLYYYISAIFSKIFGIGFFPLRFLSILSSLGCFIIIFLFVKRETKSSFYGTVSACLYAATFSIGGSWFDIARVDSLFMFFLLCSIFTLRFSDSILYHISAGVLISLAFLTKQAALLIAMPLCVYTVVYFKRWSRFIYPLTILFIIGLTTVLFNRISNGWYSYYIFKLPNQHAIMKSMVYKYWILDIINPLSIAFGISLFFLFYLLIKSNYNDLAFFALLFIGMMGSSWLSRMHSGGYNNVLLPAYAIIAIYLGLGVHILLSDVQRKFNFEKPKALILLLCTFQFIALIYNPKTQLPSKADKEAGDYFINLLKNIEGEVFIPCHGFLPSLAGKKSYAHQQAIMDIMRSNDEQLKQKLVREITEMIHTKKCNAIIVNDSWFMEDIKKNYSFKMHIFSNPFVFFPVVGMRTRPDSLYIPKEG